MRWIISVPAEGSVRAGLPTEIHVIENVGVGPLRAWTPQLFVSDTRNCYWNVSLCLPGDPGCGWGHRAQLDHIDPVHRNGDVTTSGQSTVDTAQKKQRYCLQRYITAVY